MIASGSISCDCTAGSDVFSNQVTQQLVAGKKLKHHTLSVIAYWSKHGGNSLPA